MIVSGRSIMNKSSGVSQKGDQEKRAILLAFLFLAAGFVILWFAKAVLKIEGEAILIALLLTPLLVYLILSGKLEEFKGPGGLEAKFAKVAGETISTASEEVRLSVEEMQIVEKEGLMLLERKRQELNEAQPIVMIMELGKRSFIKERLSRNTWMCCPSFAISNSSSSWIAASASRRTCHHGH
jgi:hypothetical protein